MVDTVFSYLFKHAACFGKTTGNRLLPSYTLRYKVPDFFLLGYCLSRLAAPFMEKKKGAHWAGAVYILVMLVLYFMPQHMDYFAAYTIGALAAFFVMCCVDRRNYRQKIFIAVTFSFP